MTIEQDALATAAVEAIDAYQHRHRQFCDASRYLASHIAKRPEVERHAYDALNVPKGDGKLPTQTWLNANLDLDPLFSAWRETRNQYEADVTLAQGVCRAAEFRAELAIALVKSA